MQPSLGFAGRESLIEQSNLAWCDTGELPCEFLDLLGCRPTFTAQGQGQTDDDRLCLEISGQFSDLVRCRVIARQCRFGQTQYP